MRTNNLILVAAASVLFVISGTLIIRGVRDYYIKRDLKNKDVVTVNRDGERDEEVELSGYFEGYYESDEDPDSYLQNDPFRDICSQFEAEEGTVVVYSNIVCFK